jgi:hypothetical protein
MENKKEKPQSLKQAIKFHLEFALTMKACGRDELAEKSFKILLELIDRDPDDYPRGSLERDVPYLESRHEF